MKRLIVTDGEKPIYPIVIGRDFKTLADELAVQKLAGRKVCVVSESTVGPLYADEVCTELSKTGASVYRFIFKAGEENKNLGVVQDLYEFLIKNHFDRKDMLAALGGGVVGDLTGFAAATYLRGIRFIQIPTSLLAQTDSSVGGKTGVDFRSYKNMVGAFYQPVLVYMNMSVLSSLSKRQFASGMGEIIKHGIIRDRDYFAWLADHVEEIKSLDPDTLEQMIYVSCQIKKEVVEHDQKEKGERAILNFGHTLGHSIEKLCGFTLYHGECVVLGMICALRISLVRGLISRAEYDSCISLFDAFGFPLTVSGISADDVIRVSKSDKKMDRGVIQFILIHPFGHAVIDRTVTDEEMREALKEVLR
ncbi:MAG: 3-dehydroquinate synthase [Lachnospiraceae bacterium]|nr:3-dehydroquinate synthase [Lachnospiraceae bacterium]